MAASQISVDPLRSDGRNLTRLEFFCPGFGSTLGVEAVLPGDGHLLDTIEAGGPEAPSGPEPPV